MVAKDILLLTMFSASKMRVLTWYDWSVNKRWEGKDVSPIFLVDLSPSSVDSINS